MKAAYSSYFRRLILLSLMTLTLLGVQLIQDSVLHHHTQHTVDCALCHFQLSDDSEFAAPPLLTGYSRFFTSPAASAQPFISHHISPYQGRAPPRV